MIFSFKNYTFSIILIILFSNSLSLSSEGQTIILKGGSREAIPLRPGMSVVEAIEHHKNSNVLNDYYFPEAIPIRDTPQMWDSQLTDGEDFELRWNDQGTFVNFAFATGDTMAQWFVPLAGCSVKSIVIYPINFEGSAEFFIHASNYDGEVTSGSCADAAGWIGLWDNGVWTSGSNECFSEPPLGVELWPLGSGGWVQEITSDCAESYIFIDLGHIGYLDVGSDPFFIDAAMTRTSGWGLGAWSIPEPPYHGFKYYLEAGTSGNPGWHIRSYGWELYAVVEYYEDIPPFITDVTTLYTTLTTEPREVSAKIWDVNPAGGNAGVAEAWLYWEAQEVPDSVQMNKVADSLYTGTIPGFDSGTDVIYWVGAVDVNGNWNYYGPKINYTIFKPNEPHLFVNNTKYDNWIDRYYLYGVQPYGGFPHDIWNGKWGPGTYDLFKNYYTIVEVQGGGPFMCSSELDSWLDEGHKNLLITGDEYLGACFYGWLGNCGDGAIDIQQGEFVRDYMGINKYYPNINFCEEGDEFGVSRLLAIPDNPISGNLYDFLGDSLYLNYDPNYEIDAENWLDGIEVDIGSHVLYYGVSGTSDSLGLPTGSDTIPVAVYTKLPNKSITAFFAFDVLSLNVRPIFSDTSWIDPGYYWIGINPLGPIPQTLMCFGWRDCFRVSIDNDIQTIAEKFALYPNYPNPFNPTTTIHFSIPTSGFVFLTVYDLLGKKVETIVNEHMEAGYHTIEWNARNLPSGIYFIRMTDNKFSQIRKVMVLK